MTSSTKLTKEYLEELQLKTVAERLHLSLPEAASVISRCLEKVAFDTQVPLDEVYQAVNSLEYIETCSRALAKSKKIDKFTEEECLASCATIWFEGKCYPRFFPNAETINEDPDKYAKSLTAKELQFTLRLAAYLYYNFEGGGITDNSYDAIEHYLNKKEKTKLRRADQKAVGALPIERIRTKLPYPMGSLEKLKPGATTLVKYLSSASLGWSVKEDGVSALVVYSGGKVQNIYSRGDGNIGGDVTFIKDFVSLPSPKEYPDIVVRGELIIKTKIFQEKYAKAYSTPRALVASKVNSGFASPWLADFSFVAYEVVDLRKKEKGKGPPKDPFSILEFEGFETAIHGTFEKPTLFDLISEYRKQRAQSEYWIDGLVIEPTDGSLPKVAFKMMLEEQSRWTKVLSVEWRASRTGKLVPRVNYEAIYVEGRRLAHSSGYNAAHIRDWNLRKGSRIKVIVSGDIIPVIQDVLEPLDVSLAPASYSLPPEKPAWLWSNKEIYLVDIEGNPDVQQKRILYFWKVLKTKGIGEKTVEKFYDAGYSTIAKMASASLPEIKSLKIKGSFGADAIFKTMHTQLQTVRFDRLVPAIGTIKNMGRKMVQEVLKYIPTLFVEPSADLKKDLNAVKIPGVAAKRKEFLIEGVPRVLDFLKSISSEDFAKALANEKARIKKLKESPKNPLINGKTVVFTGFFGDIDFQLEDYIYDQGGDISSTITSSTAALICRNPADFSKKIQLASELKVPVLTVPEFLRLFGTPFADDDVDFSEEE